MTSPVRCARCGVLREDGAPAPCPGCLLQGALPPPVEEPPRAGETIGPYELLERIARGGMGVIYRARRIGSAQPVALKLLPGGELADEGAQLRFQAEAQAASLLQHPNIVPLYEVGEHNGALFFTMRLMEGGSLADHLPVVRLDRRRSCALLACVARAVHHGHQHGILHRDLKPANLLLDVDGNAHVADFGIAKHLEQSSGLTQTGAVVGTPAYMAPEQARGEARSVTVAADVYSLGAILFELLTGSPPFSAATRERLLQKVQLEEPARPRSLDPSIGRDLETVCLKCLEKRPEQRYHSAEALADDLERTLRGEPIAARAVGRTERTWRWARRHPVMVGLVVFFGLFGSSSAGVVIFETSQQKSVLRADVLSANVFAARAVAEGVAFELREHSQRVHRVAEDPEVRASFDRDGGLSAPHVPAVDALADDVAFDNAELLDGNGAVVARWPEAPEQLGRRFDWRDYFRGAARLERGVYVSRAIESVVDGRIKFSLSAPIRSASGELLGVVSGMVATDSTLGALHFKDPDDPGRMAVLIAPRDRDNPDAVLTDRWVVVVHDGLVRGQTIEFVSPALMQGAQSAADHRDLVPGYEKGRWLAGFAPVADTGLVVVVQTRDLERQGTSTVLFEIGVLLALCGLAGLSSSRFVGRRL